MRSLLLGALVFAFRCVIAQEEYGAPKLEDLVKIPPSPEAQAFAKFGSTPVNLFSGTPEISIPIYTIQGREFSVPVTLTYDASGIKVDQTSTWAGLGWNLTVGGMITRQVRGKPDDYIAAQFEYHPFYTEDVFEDYKFVVGFAEGTQAATDWERYLDFAGTSFKAINEGNLLEFQQDTYSLSAPGLSGTIYVNYDSMLAYCMEHPEWKIEPSFEAVGTFGVLNITEWRITDESGNYFVFEKPEITYVVENNFWDGTRDYNSAWALTRIESKSKRDTITFSYNSQLWEQPRMAGRSEYRIDFQSNDAPCGSDNQVNPALEPTYKIQQAELSEISLNGNVIVVIDAKTRLDLEGKSAIKAVRILDPSGNLLNKWKFIHSYFTTASPGNENDYRLKLDRLEVYGSDTTAVPQQYRFEYYHEDLAFPSRESFAQDLWGYYNGVEANATLIPYNYAFDKSNYTDYSWKGSDRRPNPEVMRIGAMKSIQYPTGGKSEFHYDPHLISAEVTEYQIPKYVTNFGMTGGTQTSNTFNYTAGDYPGYPLGTKGSFNVESGGLHQLTLSLSTGEENYVPGWAFAAIYRTGDVDCDENDNCNYGEELDFEEINTALLPQGELPWFFYGGVGYNMSNIVEVNLPAGAYRYLLLNADSHADVNVDITAYTVEKSHITGGLRVTKIVDKDEAGEVASTKLYYYDDLALVPNDSVGYAISNTSTLESGTLHATLEFDEDRAFQKYNQDQPFFQDILDCWKKTRYGNNRLSTDQSVSYPVVTEVQIGLDNRINGFVVSEFATGVGFSREGYTKGSPINGRLTRKRTYNSASQLISDEQNSYTVRTVNSGAGEVTGIYFYFQNQDLVDAYVRHPTGSPGVAFLDYSLVLNQEGSPFHCGNNNVAGHTTYACYPLGGTIAKSAFSFPRRWATLDSSRTVQYYPNGQLVTLRRTFYDSLSHYQPTLIEQTDSRGVNHKIALKYPHEMAAAESNPIWDALISRHQLNEQLQVTSTYGSNSPDFKKKTEYNTFSNGSGYTRYLPDTIKMSSGTGSLEARIKYHAYDQVGNPLEIARFNDAHTSYIWGYDKTYPVATIANASSNEVFFNGFEYDPDLGNSSDSHTGLKCKTGGYSKTLTGLTAYKAYVLNYWSKDSNIWRNHTVSIAASSSTSYSISLSGQVDDVRLYPAIAKMTSYTYKPLVGITSVSDPNNQPVFYEYDSFGRLVVVRDAKGQIMKTQSYQYFNPDQPVADNH